MLGDKNPMDARSPHDLGRFGMGLKTASFSQCKRLTVASKKEGITSCLRWDLDVLTENPDMGWVLIEGPVAGSEDLPEKLQFLDHGTIVIWEVLDRIITESFTVDDFLTLIEEQVERHLAMVFRPLTLILHMGLHYQTLMNYLLEHIYLAQILFQDLVVFSIILIMM